MDLKQFMYLEPIMFEMFVIEQFSLIDLNNLGFVSREDMKASWITEKRHLNYFMNKNKFCTFEQFRSRFTLAIKNNLFKFKN